MAKRKNKAAGKKGGSGCGGLLILLVLAAIFGRPGQPGSTPKSTATPRATSTIRTQAQVAQPRNTSVPTRTPAPTRTLVPTQMPDERAVVTSLSVAQRDVALPVSTTSTQNVDARNSTSPMRTALPQSNTIRAEDYTATGNANVRSCPNTDCEIVYGISLGERLIKVGEVEGELINHQSRWYEILLPDGTTGFISATLTRAGTPRPAPVVQQPRATTAPNQAAPTSVDNTQPEAPVVQATQPPASGNNQRPGNCATAVAMNLSPQQAAQWPHLDRDKDGVACYGD